MWVLWALIALVILALIIVPKSREAQVLLKVGEGKELRVGHFSAKVEFLDYSHGRLSLHFRITTEGSAPIVEDFSIYPPLDFVIYPRNKIFSSPCLLTGSMKGEEILIRLILQAL